MMKERKNEKKRGTGYKVCEMINFKLKVEQRIEIKFSLKRIRTKRIYCDWRKFAIKYIFFAIRQKIK